MNAQELTAGQTGLVAIIVFCLVVTMLLLALGPRWRDRLR